MNVDWRSVDEEKNVSILFATLFFFLMHLASRLSALKIPVHSQIIHLNCQRKSIVSNKQRKWTKKIIKSMQECACEVNIGVSIFILSLNRKLPNAFVLTANESKVTVTCTRV